MRKFASLTATGIFAFSAVTAPLALAAESFTHFYSPVQGPNLPVYGPHLPQQQLNLAWRDESLPWLNKAADVVMETLASVTPHAGKQVYGPYLPSDARYTAMVKVAAIEVAQMDEDGTFFTASTSVGDGELDASRGTGPAFSAETLGVSFQEAIVVKNSTDGTVSGNNMLTQNAFNGAAGLVSVIQNTGNNVVIQNATVVNLNMQ